MVKNPDINAVIWMFRHYQNRARDCWDIYKDIEQAAYMWDYNMGMAEMYEYVLKTILT